MAKKGEKTNLSTEKQEHQCPEGEMWSEEHSKCMAKPKPEGEAKSTDKALTDRILDVVGEAMTKKLADFEKKMDEKLDNILKAKEIEVERALRKGFGLEEDPVVHMSDLITYGRKLALEKAETGKRTPGKEEAGPEGTSKEHPVDALFKAFELKETKS